MTPAFRSVRCLADLASVRRTLSQVLAGEREPSIAVLTALTDALGADLSIRVYPGTGPKLRDGIQARIVEELVRLAASTWRRSVEVPVSRPARGYIDVVFDDPVQSVIVATEVQSRIERLEQQVRWAQDKANSLPSAELWRFLPGAPAISRLLVLRSTVSTRELARRFQSTLTSAYPARAADVHLALIAGVVPWPGGGSCGLTSTGMLSASWIGRQGASTLGR